MEMKTLNQSTLNVSPPLQTLLWLHFHSPSLHCRFAATFSRRRHLRSSSPWVFFVPLHTHSLSISASPFHCRHFRSARHHCSLPFVTSLVATFVVLVITAPVLAAVFIASPVTTSAVLAVVAPVLAVVFAATLISTFVVLVVVAPVLFHRALLRLLF
ncbi:hypothetical protein HN873_009232 [Arachis hypogaea]